MYDVFFFSNIDDVSLKQLPRLLLCHTKCPGPLEVAQVEVVVLDVHSLPNITHNGAYYVKGAELNDCMATANCIRN